MQSRDGFDVLPAHVNLDDLEDKSRSSTFGMLWVRRRIVESFLDDEYDYSVIDSPPSLGPLSDASLISARNVVVPLLMSEPSVSGFERMWEHQDGEAPAEGGADGEYDGHHPEGEPAYGVGHGEKQVAITAPIPAATSRGT